MKPILLLFGCIALSYGLPTLSEKGSEEQNEQLAQAYISQFYEQKADSRQRGWKINNLSFVDKIKQMQDFFRLNVTGKVDAETLEVMQQPRCGIPDIGQYVLALPGWRKMKLTYRIANYTPDMRRADVDASIKKAFEVWSKVTPLAFVRIHRGRADIVIEFATRVHGRCPRQFDGPLGVLGHAFPPGHYFRGNVHFDEDETWVANLYEQRRSRNYPVVPAEDVRTPVLKKVPKLKTSAVPLPYSAIKFNLFLVAAHEIGHVLGLAHSNDPRALMFPNYKPIDPDDSPLSEDDINAIQAIYGPSQNPSNEPVKPTLPKACDPKLNFDAITTFRREVIFFKGRHIWRVYPTRSEVDMEPISTLSPLLPSGIQAAYENMNDQVFSFKGPHYWTTQGFHMQGPPRSIADFGFSRNVPYIDAAVYLKDEKKTLFFVEDEFYSYDETKRKMDKDSPKTIEDEFSGINGRIDAAVEVNGFIYFFSGPKAYKYDREKEDVVNVVKSSSWVGC
ncbi:matrix metalloproteinase-27-like [Notechis scutatus]|uniref:Matrix metalloproteinase-27-like n=1 Tax=Notechis scutatus TaxID=8663 RepID=A0A6J1USA9_9SAUR|nr:matrix metalloproteinase-27-like [Notechis scutatus]